MSYFKINNNDYSNIVSSLKVGKANNYNSQTNAAGDTVVDYINSKREIEVGFIALDNEAMINLQEDIAAFNVAISFLNPATGLLVDNINCIIENNEIEFYTIQVNKVMYRAFNLKFIEL